MGDGVDRRRQKATQGIDHAQGQATLRPHVVLVGFMGSGKSATGQKLADVFGMDFVDIDDAIALEAGESIADIFHHQGEVGFRAMERGVMNRVLERPRPAVIATGGGTFIDPTLRRAIGAKAHSIYLKATVETLHKRIGTGREREQRPLLSGPDVASTIKRLLTVRGPAYDQCDYTVETDGLDVEAVVERMCVVLEKSTPTRGQSKSALAAAPAVEGSGVAHAAGSIVRVETPSRAYDVEVRHESGAWIAQRIAELCEGTRVALITDTTVEGLIAQSIAQHLREHTLHVSVHAFSAGESYKTLATAAGLYDELLAAKVGRQDLLVAVGGGVVGDVTGFVASTLLRGLGFVQVPTTTLAAIDSSVGGKTAVNTPRGKNLVGTFYQPQGVLLATSHFATLPPREFSAGMCEALKMAAALDAGLFAKLESAGHEKLSKDSDLLAEIIMQSIEIKAGVVSRDERERGERAVLNFGHTLGHAIEKGENYRLLHGEAVALGMMAEAEWAEAEGISPGLTAQLESALTALALPTEWRRRRMDLSALELDKKRVGGDVKLPVVPELGTFEIRAVPVAALIEFVKRRSAA